MQITRHVPHFRSIKASVLTLVALFVAANISDISIFKAVAPTVTAQTQLAARFINPPDYPTSGDARIDELIYRAGRQHGLDPRLIHAVILQESRYKKDAVSYAGAEGLMQLMPATARQFGVRNAFNPIENIRAGVAYLRHLLDRYRNDETLALADVIVPSLDELTPAAVGG